MSDDAPTLGWSPQQWSALRAVVQESARKSRVASRFLPISGPLPPEQTTVPALRLQTIDLPANDRLRGEAEQRLETKPGQTLRLATISALVYLRSSEMADPELASAKSTLRHAAQILGRLEDAIVFLGQPGEGQYPTRPGNPPDPIVKPVIYTVSGGETIAGLLESAPHTQTVAPGKIVEEIILAVEKLETEGHFGPFAVVLGHQLFSEANSPTGSMVLPSDRIIPFLDGGPLLRSSALPETEGIVVALAGAPVELVIASDMDLKFVQATLEPRYVLRLSERMVLHVKQPEAIRRLEGGSTSQPTSQTGQPSTGTGTAAKSGSSNPQSPP